LAIYISPRLGLRDVLLVFVPEELTDDIMPRLLQLVLLSSFDLLVYLPEFLPARDIDCMGSLIRNVQ